MLTRRFSAQETREKLADILGMVYYGGEPVIIEKRGNPVAVVINPKDYEILIKEREARFKVLDRIWEKMPPDTDPQEVERVVNDEVHALRQERRQTQKENERNHIK